MKEGWSAARASSSLHNQASLLPGTIGIYGGVGVLFVAVRYGQLYPKRFFPVVGLHSATAVRLAPSLTAVVGLLGSNPEAKRQFRAVWLHDPITKCRTKE